MTTSQTTTLYEPTGSERIPDSTLRYMRTRNRRRLYSLIIGAFKESELTQAELARRIGKPPEVICRWFSGPTNWRADTISDLLFAISGADATYGIAHPLKGAKRNSGFPEWLIKEPEEGKANLDERKPERPGSLNTSRPKFKLAEAHT